MALVARAVGMIRRNVETRLGAVYLSGTSAAFAVVTSLLGTGALRWGSWHLRWSSGFRSGGRRRRRQLALDPWDQGRNGCGLRNPDACGCRTRNYDGPSAGPDCGKPRPY